MAWVLGIGVFLFLLFAFPRQVGGLIAILIAIGALAWGYFYIQDAANKRLLAKIDMTADAAGNCDATYPIEVSVYNGTPKSIDSISFTLTAKKTGFSSEVYSSYLTTDRILQPKARYVACWSLSSYDLQYGKIRGVPVNSLVWSAKPSHVEYSK